MNSGTDALNIKNRDFLFFAALIGGAAIFLISVPTAVLSPILILLCGLIIGILIIAIFAQEDFYFLSKLYLIGLGIRAFLSYFFYILAFVFKGDKSHGFLFSNDGWCYSEQGWQICKFVERGIKITREGFMTNPNIKIESGNITIYDFFASFVYSITGKSPLSLFFISAVAGSLAALFIYLIAKELFSKKVARISSVFAFFWPSFIMWSTQNLKDVAVAMFIFILLWAIFYMYRYPFPGFLISAVISIWALSKLSIPFLAIVIGMVFFAGLFLFIDYLFKNRFLTVLITGLLFMVFLVLFKNEILNSFIKKSAYWSSGSYDSIFEFLNYHRSVRAYGSLRFLKNFDISSFGRAAVFAPIGLTYSIFAPFPWQLGSIMQIMVVPETIAFYILAPLTLKGIIFAYKKRFNQSILLLSIIAAMLLFLGLVEGNAGTLFRHRLIAFYLLFIFTAIGISLKKDFRKNAPHN